MGSSSADGHAADLNSGVISFSQFVLTERVLSIGLNPAHEKYREQHRQDIHDLLHKSYKPIGGYCGHKSGSKEESDAIHHDISHQDIKAVRRNGKITAAHLYKKHHGRKGVGLGSDGTEQGKSDAKKIMADDHKQKRSWAEVSGAIEHIHKKMGSPVVPNKDAERLTGKKDIEHDPNGTHYTRQIGGERHRKVIMGHPKD